MFTYNKLRQCRDQSIQARISKRRFRRRMVLGLPLAAVLLVCGCFYTRLTVDDPQQCHRRLPTGKNGGDNIGKGQVPPPINVGAASPRTDLDSRVPVEEEYEVSQTLQLTPRDQTEDSYVYAEAGISPMIPHNDTGNPTPDEKRDVIWMKIWKAHTGVDDRLCFIFYKHVENKSDFDCWFKVEGVWHRAYLPVTIRERTDAEYIQEWTQENATWVDAELSEEKLESIRESLKASALRTVDGYRYHNAIDEDGKVYRLFTKKWEKTKHLVHIKDLLNASVEEDGYQYYTIQNQKFRLRKEPFWAYSRSIAVKCILRELCSLDESIADCNRRYRIDTPRQEIGKTFAQFVLNNFCQCTDNTQLNMVKLLLESAGHDIA